MKKRKIDLEINILGVNNEFWNLRYDHSKFKTEIEHIQKNRERELKIKSNFSCVSESFITRYLVTPDLDYKKFNKNSNWNISFKRMYEVIKKSDQIGSNLKEFTENDFEDITKLVMVTRETIDNILDDIKKINNNKDNRVVITSVITNSLLEKIDKNMIMKDINGDETLIPLSFIIYGIMTKIKNLTSKNNLEVNLSTWVQSIEILPSDILIN